MRTWKPTALPFRDCLHSAFSRKCFSETHSMCKTHLPAAPPPPPSPGGAPVSCISPVSQDCGDTGACRSPWLSELVDIRLCQGPTASLQLAGIEPFCRDKIVMNLSSLDRLWLSSPGKPRQRLDWQPGDWGSRPPWSQGILWKQTA